MKLEKDGVHQAWRLRGETELNHTHGNGAAIVVRPANNAVAPTVPRRSYIAPAKRGNAAAKAHRKAVLPAMADAAIGR